MAASFAAHEWSAQQILSWDWDQPYAAISRSNPQALDEPEAYAKLAGGDPRPLLVVRECGDCQGSDDAFLSREFGNDKTILLARWFHTVKLPPEVLDEAHPFHAVFDAKKKVPHLFFANADGSDRVELDGQQKQSKLWSSMTKVLKKNYKKDPNKAVKAMLDVLHDLDLLDARIAMTEERLLDETAEKGKTHKSVKDLKAELEEQRAEREAVIDKAEAIDDLQLKPKR